MARVPRPGGRDMVRFLKREGFSVLRINGSHYFLNRGEIDTVVPVHGNETIRIWTLRKILRDIQMTAEEFERRFNA